MTPLRPPCRHHNGSSARPSRKKQNHRLSAGRSIRLEVRLENETVWLSQDQIALLFGTQRPAITKHLANIYKAGELDEKGTCSILEHMGHDGQQSYRTKYYNLDAILSIGYRVNSRNATLFRRWASGVLKDYLLRGYAVNNRLDRLETKASLKDLGKSLFAFSRMELPAKELLDRLP